MIVCDGTAVPEVRTQDGDNAEEIKRERWTKEADKKREMDKGDGDKEEDGHRD